MKKILVVDNDQFMLEFISDTLLKEGHQVVTAEDGISALDILKTYTPNVIFTDLVMPNISGDKLCRIIRERPDLKDVYIIILTAIAADEELAFSEFGANACIAKGPFDKMAQHILSAMDHSDPGAGRDLPEKIIGIEDVSQQEITKELLFSRRHFELILKNMSEGILELTLEPKIVYANPAAILLTGIPEEKLLALNFTDLFNEADRESIENLLKAEEDTQQRITGEALVILNGKEVSINIIPVKDEEHKSVIVILNDVSEQKRMEAQLRQAQKMEAIGTLAGGIAHEFNNQLMGIQGNASLILLDVEPGHSHYEKLKHIEQRVARMAELTKQLLDFARGGKYKVKLTDLNDLIKKSSEMFGRTKKEITIHSEYQDDIWTVEVDRDQIEQVLLNLYVNAWQAMSKRSDATTDRTDSMKLYVKTENVALDESSAKPFNVNPGDYVMISVTDTGVGMDEITRQKIFDPFFTDKDMGGGAGLGLASVYGIIRNHNGIIDVHSEKGQGTTFNIYLPASEKEAAKEMELPEEILKGTETILLVDDEDMIIDVGEQMLRIMGYTVLLARGGKEAVEIVSKTHNSLFSPDLVILDVFMPDMRGGDTYDNLKEINPNIKVLLSSGHSINGQATEILERGCNGFIQKPFDIKELSHRIREVLD